MTSMVPVQIVGIRLDPHAGMSAVLLGEPDEMTRVLPIMIGLTEAQSIARFLTGTVNSRPCTHDLATTLMAVAGSRLEEVVVTELRDGVFFAELFIEAGDGMTSLSARPSDGIALAVRVGAPIYVRSNVLDEAAVSIEHTPTAPLSDEEIEQVVSDFQAFLESTTAEDFEPEHWTKHAGQLDEDVGQVDDD
jgi:bifunctional DNase/RNase